MSGAGARALMRRRYGVISTRTSLTDTSGAEAKNAANLDMVALTSSLVLMAL